MTTPSERDDELLGLIARALQPVAPAPEHILVAARAAWTWRSVDEELAALSHDSALEASAVRGDMAATSAVLAAGEAAVSIEVAPDGSGLVLRVLPAPTAPGTQVVVLGSDGSRRTSVARDDGAFVVESVPDGLIRVLVERRDGTSSASPWCQPPTA